MFSRFFITASVWALISAGAILPVAGSIGSWPEMKSSPAASTACE